METMTTLVVLSTY